MRRTRLLIARIAGVVVLLLACLVSRYSPGPLGKPLFGLSMGVLCFSLAYGVFGPERRRIFWIGFAVLLAVFGVMGVVELVRIFGRP